MQKPGRILFKLSGEVLGSQATGALDSGRLAWLAEEIADARDCGVDIAVVVGAGNIVRGATISRSGVDRVTADYMGMLGTVINAMAVAAALEATGVAARVMSAIQMAPAVERYSRGAALKALERGETVVFGAGTGNPYFTTDSAAALRAVEIGADLLAKGTKVDGVYDKDPVLHADAKVYGRISYDQVLADRLEVMDATAVAMCRDNELPVLVFKPAGRGSLARIAEGELPGTLMA